jgi:hypothetical protein
MTRGVLRSRSTPVWGWQTLTIPIGANPWGTAGESERRDAVAVAGVYLAGGEDVPIQQLADLVGLPVYRARSARWLATAGGLIEHVASDRYEVTELGARLVSEDSR